MSAKITEDDRKAIESIINRWHGKREAYARGLNSDCKRQVGNWLFGLQVGLQAMGLTDLALMADDAQNVDSYEK